MITNYNEAVAYLLNIPKFAAKTSHGNLRGFLELLGNPHTQTLTVHVAGTNGKGSTCAFLASILQQAGYRTGLFTSPHLIKINERFRVNGEMIGDEAFLNVFRRVYDAVEQGKKQGLAHPSFFEFLFLMGACWYQEQQVDYVVYETGLGGRLDATNVLQPSLTVITSIGMDHMQYLGDTLEQIAGEKAGILKVGIPCVYLDQKDIAADVIESRGRELGCSMIPVEKDRIWIDEIGKDSIDFSYRNRYDSTYSSGKAHIPYRMKKTALYQLENAALAIEAGYELLLRPGRELQAVQVVCKGIEMMRWPGRMEEVEPDVYVDGAHNEPAIRAFCHTLVNIYPDKKIVLLFAVAEDKQYNKMIRILCESVSCERIFVTAIAESRTAPIRQVAEQFEYFTETPVQTEPDPIRALRLAKAYAGTDCRVFCVGSLYLAGSIKAQEGEKRND